MKKAKHSTVLGLGPAMVRIVHLLLQVQLQLLRKKPRRKLRLRAVLLAVRRHHRDRRVLAGERGRDPEAVPVGVRPIFALVRELGIEAPSPIASRTRAKLAFGPMSAAHIDASRRNPFPMLGRGNRCLKT